MHTTGCLIKKWIKGYKCLFQKKFPFRIFFGLLLIGILCLEPQEETLLTHLAKSHILKSSPKYTCYTTNTTSDLSRISVTSTEFTYFSRNVSETHTSLHSSELELILRYVWNNLYIRERPTVALFCTQPVMCIHIRKG